MAVTNPNQKQYQMPSMAPLVQPTTQTNNLYKVSNQNQQPYKTVTYGGGLSRPVGPQPASNAVINKGSSYPANIGSQQWTPPKPNAPSWSGPIPSGAYGALGLSPPIPIPTIASTLGNKNTKQAESLWQAVNGFLPFPEQDYSIQNGYWANSPQGDAATRIQQLNALSGKGINVPQYDPLTGYIINTRPETGGIYMGLDDYLRTPEAIAGYSQSSQQQNPFSLSPGQGFNSSVGIFGPQGTNVQSNFAGGNMNGMNTVQGQGLPGGSLKIGGQFFGKDDIMKNPSLGWSALGIPQPSMKSRLAGMGNPNAALGRRSNFALR